MKILHILDSIERSGAEVMLAQAAPLFLEQGVDLHALATGESVGPFAPELIKAGYTVHDMPFVPSVAFLSRFWRLVRRGHFDVVHVHTERAFFWYELLARLAGVGRIIRTIHNVFEFRGALWLERWGQRHLAESILGERAVAPSKSVWEAERRVYGLKRHVILNWTDPLLFAPARTVEERMRIRAGLGFDEQAVVYVSVGSCSPVKNHAAVLRAVAKIAPICPNAHYLHVGGGELEPGEQTMARDLGLSRNVTFIGQRDDMPQLLQASDVFVMPSTREGLSIACLEAMSCGLSVIATNAPGLRDLVIDGESGRLVQGQDELARAMAELYDDERLRAAMGKSGRARVLGGFNMAKAVASYVSLYKPQVAPRAH